MSELKAYTFSAMERTGLADYYLKSEADKVIEELEDKCRMHDFFCDGCGFAKRGFKNTIAVSETFDRTEADNYRLKHALWTARANRAHAEWAHWTTIWFRDTTIELNINKASVSQGPYRCALKRKAAIWRNLWRKIEFKCRAKAEEYK